MQVTSDDHGLVARVMTCLMLDRRAKGDGVIDWRFKGGNLGGQRLREQLDQSGAFQLMQV